MGGGGAGSGVFALAAPVHMPQPACMVRKKAVIAWLSRHPRGTFHFTPISASWLNAGYKFGTWSPTWGMHC